MCSSDCCGDELMIIEDNGEDIQIEGEPCPTCESEYTVYNREFGFWKCEECSTVWGHDKDDPDYDEVEVEDETALG
jgi:ribosomal protein L37AE/L43A